MNGLMNAICSYVIYIRITYHTGYLRDVHENQCTNNRSDEYTFESAVVVNDGMNKCDFYTF